MNLERKYQRLLERRFDSINEGYQRLVKASDSASVSRAFDYLIGAMDEVNPEKALNAGRRVRDELKEAFTTKGIFVEFDFQGSTTNGTNIKKSSDVDLLVVNGYCFSAEPGTHNNFPDYAGSIYDEVVNIRSVCIAELTSRYWAAEVIPGAKSIKIQGGSLERDVDVVPCNWYRTAQHEANPEKYNLGIRIRDVEKQKWIHNFPFLHNALIELKDLNCSGNLRKMIRLLKNIREDAEDEIKVSSYDITALVYLMPTEELKARVSESIVPMVSRLLSHLNHCITDKNIQTSATVPHGQNKLFAPFGGLDITELKKLAQELELILREVNSGLWPGLLTLLNAGASNGRAKI